ncbi:DNA repair REX1-B-domain-containing protein [Dipodascopsis uninucleata]
MAANGLGTNGYLIETDSNPENVLKYMKTFTSAQSTRTELYHEFESAMEDYTNGRISIEEIQQVIRISQEGFQDISSDIIRQEHLLNECNQSHLANIIRQVQNLEKEKLEITVKLLSCRIHANSSPERSFDSELRDLSERRTEIIRLINEMMEEARAEMLELDVGI